MSDDDSLKIIDTSEGLTKEELAELKRLANMSKSARTVMAFAIAVVALFGVDRAISFIQHIQYK